MQTLRLGSLATFPYTNHRNVTETRRVIVLGIQFGENEFYRTPQWLLQTFDLDRNAFRSFSLDKINTQELRVSQ